MELSAAQKPPSLHYSDEASPGEIYDECNKLLVKMILFQREDLQAYQLI